MVTLYTIGHVNYDLTTFSRMLKFANITMIEDVRAFPKSPKHPQYNQQELKQWLLQQDINYRHNSLLGGRRPLSQHVGQNLNAGWLNQSFHNYADYTLTAEFKEGIEQLLVDAQSYNVAMLCAERHPARCHRLIISNWLVAQGYSVEHIVLSHDNQVELVPHQLGQWGAMPIIEDDNEVVYPQNVST